MVHTRRSRRAENDDDEAQAMAGTISRQEYVGALLCTLLLLILSGVALFCIYVSALAIAVPDPGLAGCAERTWLVVAGAVGLAGWPGVLILSGLFACIAPREYADLYGGAAFALFSAYEFGWGVYGLWLYARPCGYGLDAPFQQLALAYFILVVISHVVWVVDYCMRGRPE